MSKRRRRLRLVKDQPRVLIGTPVASDVVLATFARSLVHCVAYSLTQGLVIGSQLAEYSLLILSRELLAQAAIEAKWTHLLFVDSDMQFEPDLALRLVRHRVPIVAANCMARRHPYYLTARSEDGNEVRTTAESSGLEKVARVGTGVMLIDLEIFKSIEKPWFDTPWLLEKGFPKGEDFYFCDKARAAGFEIYIDHDVSKQVCHVGQFAYSPLHREGFLEAQREATKAASDLVLPAAKGIKS